MSEKDELLNIIIKISAERERLKNLLLDMISENAELSAELYSLKHGKEANGDDGIEVD